MRKWIVPCIVWIFLGVWSVSTVSASGRKNKKKIEAQPGKYEKLFQGKQYTTVSGDFMTLHKMDGKLYFEMPLKWMGKDMLLASAVSRTSDNLAAVCGYSPGGGMHVRFVIQDSTVQLRLVATSVTADGNDPRMRQVMAQGYSDPILYGYKILAYSPDRSAVVFEVTSLFTSDVKELTPIVPASGMFRVTGKMIPAYSQLGEVKAFDDNISVRSSLSYSIGVYYFIFPMMKQEPVTVEVTRTLMLLPEDKMRSRLADSRIGLFLTERKHIPAEGEAIRPYSLARRWRIEPSDADAYRQGVLTEPTKPIVMYIDEFFPEEWKEPIKRGILRWNKAFEKIGFKNVIEVRDFPKDDPDFDPDNLKYSCVRYIPFTLEEGVGPFWVDPSSGEILNARILIFNDVVKAINRDRFIQTAQLDPSVRGQKMPDAIIAESLEWMAAQKMGNCLGLMNNLAASYAYPVDSLRSVSFTSKHGITPSIMDRVQYNYVAQPEDRGVKLTPPDLGEYDEFMIKWLYTPLWDKASREEESRVLESWIDEKAGNPVYRFGKQQWISMYDPSALENDLGDDALRAGDYGVANLKYIVSNLKDWIEDDTDAAHRKQLYSALVTQYERYLTSAMVQVGGIYLTDVKEGTPGERFRPVTRERQKAAVQWIVRQLKESEWLDNRELLGKFALGLPDSWRTRSNMISRLLSRKSYVALSAHLADYPYPMDEFMQDMYDEVWKSAWENQELTLIDKLLQTEWLGACQSRVATIGGKQFTAANFLTSEEADLTAFGSGYGWQQLIETRVLENEAIYYYKLVQDCNKMLRQKVVTAREDERPHYRAMLLVTEKILEEKYK